MPRSVLELILVVATLGGGVSAQVVITNKPASIRAQHYYAFTVSLNGTNVGSGVSWTVNTVAGGNATVGTFSGFRYNAPAFAPNPVTVTITATSVANTALSDSATVTILNPTPSLASVTPSPLPVGTSVLTFNGYGFV